MNEFTGVAPGALLLTDKSSWGEALRALGCSSRTAEQYATALARASAVLREVRGTDLYRCNDVDLAEVVSYFPPSHGSLGTLRSALSYAWRILGRLDPPKRIAVPSRYHDDMSGLAPAKQLGGYDPAGERRRLETAEARRLLAEMSAHGWTRRDVAQRLEVSEERLRPRGFMVDALLAERIRRLAGELLSPGAPRGPGSGRLGKAGIVEMDPRFGVEEIMAIGMSKRTSYLYMRVLSRATLIIRAERAVDLDTCSSRDLLCLLPHFPGTYSGRQMLRSALRAGFEVIGREDPPSLKSIRMPPKPQPRSRAITHEDAIRLERAAWDRGDEKGLAVLVGLYAGLRRAEIARLTWGQVVDDSSGRPQWMKIVGKGDKEGLVPLNPHLAEVLQAWRKPWSVGFLFKGRQGQGVSDATIWAWTKEVAASIGVPLSTHQLRHTALTEANDATSDLRSVQELARHSKPETTAIYTRVTGQRLLQVAAAIDYGRRPDSGETDPADTLPAVGYRQVMVALEGNEERAAAWVALGLALHEAGWVFRVQPGGFWHWVCSDHQEFTATASICPVRGAEFTLFRQYDDDTADTWDLGRPQLVAALAEALVSGVPAPSAVRLGPWIEKPFVQYLAGESPDWDLLRAPLVGVGGGAP